MELSVSSCLVLTLSLVNASPYGYGAKSGAVAKAEASAGSFDSLSHTPLIVPGSSGFSGSFSKSSSSSFASSSASSSSSSFSYSGAEGGIVPGFGEKLGCGEGCQNGVNNDFVSSGQGFKNNGGFGGAPAHAFAGASASAGAVANIPVAGDQPCHGSNCFITSDKKCTTGQCENTNANGNNVQSNENSASESIGNESNDFSVNKPYSTKENANDNIDIKNKDDKVIGRCEGPECRTFLPLTPHGNNDNNLNKKPETSYQEQACATHDCNLAGSTNQRKPSSYNVPILGPQMKLEKENPICTSGNCHDANHVENHNYDEKVLQATNLNKPSTTIQLPTGSLNAPALCNSKDCYNPSYNQGELGSHTKPLNNKPLLNNYGPLSKPSYNYNTPPGTPNQPLPDQRVNPSAGSGISYTPNAPVGSESQPNFGLTPSYFPNKDSDFNPNGSQRYDHNAPLQTVGPQGNINNLHHPSINSASHSIQSAGNKRPVHEQDIFNRNPIKPSFDTRPTSTAGSEFSPSSGITSSTGFSHPTEHSSSYGVSDNKPNCNLGNCAYPLSPSYSLEGPSNSKGNGPTSSDADLICPFGDCSRGPQSGHPISNKPFNINSNLQPSHTNLGPASNLINQFDCATPNCHPSFVNENSQQNKPASESSISVKPNPSLTDSEVLLSNKGNKIYSGGFGGPVGILSANNNGKPNSGIIINPDSGINHNSPHNAIPQLPLGPNYMQSVQAHSHETPKPVNNNNVNKPGPLVPIVANFKPEDNKRPYSGGFGGPAGLLKPNEFKIPPNTPVVGCSSGNCHPNQGTQNGGSLAATGSGAYAAAAANVNAAPFAGSFGGPPGLLKPYDEGKLYQTDKNVIGKDKNFGNLGPNPHSNVGGDNQANAVASASAVAGSYGQPGGCNTGCMLNGDNHHQGGTLGHTSSGVADDHNQASATASAKSVASSYSQGRSLATASAHASAGASVKGGAWR